MRRDGQWFFELPLPWCSGGTPPLPACKSNDCNRLAHVIAAKILQPNGLRPKYCQQRTYWLKCESPSRCRSFFLISILSIAVWMELTCQLYFLLFEGVRWFWGLTCDFWAENSERKMTAPTTTIE